MLRRHSYLARIAAVTILSWGSACSGDNQTGPQSGEWWEGAWVAVRANDRPLPFVSERSTTVRELVLDLHRDTTRASTFVSNGTRTTPMGPVQDPVARTVVVSAGTDTVHLYSGPTSTIGQLSLTLRRKADTLVLPSYSAGEFKLVRVR